MKNANHVKVDGFKISYKWFGPRPSVETPLLVLHGGPGFPHDYLLPLANLATENRAVVFYDQLGCGLSQRPKNKAIYTIDWFVNELTGVRRALGLDKVYLLGHSWGGMLALDYVLRNPAGVEGLVVASAAAASEQFSVESRRLLSELPGNALKVVDRCEANGTTDSAAYDRVNRQFLKHHVFRARVKPACYQAANDKSGEAYEVMWGPSEFSCTGNLRDWSVRERLSEISIPTLITCGRHDESTPRINLSLRRAIRGSNLRIFERSAHMVHLEETDRYIREVRRFLGRLDRAAVRGSAPE